MVKILGVKIVQSVWSDFMFVSFLQDSWMSLRQLCRL